MVELQDDDSVEERGGLILTSIPSSVIFPFSVRLNILSLPSLPPTFSHTSPLSTNFLNIRLTLLFSRHSSSHNLPAVISLFFAVAAPISIMACTALGGCWVCATVEDMKPSSRMRRREEERREGMTGWSGLGVRGEEAEEIG